MALNSNGSISLGGSVTGQSIALELSLSATAQISLNDTTVRTLLGNSSGQISMVFAYSKSSGAYFLAQMTTNGQAGAYTYSSGDVDSSGNIYMSYGKYNAGNTFFHSINSIGNTISQVSNDTFYPHLSGFNASRLDSTGNLWITSADNIFGRWNTQKMNTSFGVLFSKYFSLTYGTYPINDIIYDSTGNTYSTTQGSHEYTYGPCNCQTGYETFDYIIKSSPVTGPTSLGTYTSSSSPALTANVSYGNLAIDGSNNIYKLLGYADNNYPKLLKINTSLSVTAQYNIIPASGYVLGKDVTTDSSGNIYLTVFNISTQEIWLVKLNSSFVKQWTRKITPPTTSRFRPVYMTKDSSDNIYILVSHYYGTGYRPVIFKYNSSGTLQWQRWITSSATADSFNVVGGMDTWGEAKLVVNSTGLYIFTGIYQFSVGYPFIAKLPLDGSHTGSTYVLNGATYTYDAFTATEADDASFFTISSTAGTDYPATTPTLTTQTNKNSVTTTYVLEKVVI